MLAQYTLFDDHTPVLSFWYFLLHTTQSMQGRADWLTLLCMYMYIYMLIKISSISCHNIAVSHYIIDTATGKACFAIKSEIKGLLYVCAINIIIHNCKLYIYARKKENSVIYGHHQCMYRVYTQYSTNISHGHYQLYEYR